jgi:hypothetical protein
MLGWIKSESSYHPLDRKDAKDILSGDVAKLSAVAALDQLALYLNDLKTTENLRPKRVFAIIDLIDRAGTSIQRKLNDDYLAEREGLTKFRENRLWSAVFVYHKELADGYRLCLAEYQVGAGGAPALKRLLPQIACRALRACATQMKWILLRHGPIEQRLWQEVVDIYRLSEKLGFAQTECSMTPQVKSTVETELLRAAMLAVSSPDALTPVQIEIAERIIEKVSASFRLSSRPSSGIFYVLDLSGRRAPSRLSPNLVFDSDTRCFGPADAFGKIEDAMRFMDRQKRLPQSIAIPEGFDINVIYATLTHLVRYWAPVASQRRDTRRRHTERVTVVHDFDEVLAAVGGLFVESAYVSNEEEWLIENESDGGFGAFAEHPQGAWLGVGKLIAIRRDEGASWNAGIVRRVSMDEKHNRYVGIEILAHGGTAVTIMAEALSARGSAISAHGEVCVLLPSSVVNSGETLLLMRAGLFSPTERLLMSVYDRKYSLRPLRIAQQSVEFDLGYYQIVEQFRGRRSNSDHVLMMS